MVRGRVTTAMPGSATSTWRQLGPQRADDLVDARLQFHHVAQLATAMGISFLPPKPDDSHTNLEWIDAVAALASRVVPRATPFRVAVRPAGLTVLVLDGQSNVL